MANLIFGVSNGTAAVGGGVGGPALNLQFAGASTLDPCVTFSRASTATYVDSSGLIQTAAIDTPRFDYDPTPLLPLGLLIEEQRTNLVLYSQDFTNAAWSSSNSTITANATTSPDGTTNADSLFETATNSVHSRYQIGKSLTAVPTSWSIYVKPNGRTWCFLSAYDGADHITYFNLSGSGSVGTSDAGNTATIQAVGAGWFRCTVTRTPTATSSGALTIGAATADATNSYLGDVTKGLYVWGAQLEAGALPTSYIPTTSATATRSDDVDSQSTSPWYSALANTIVVSAISPAVGTRIVWQVDDGTANNRITIWTNGTTATADIVTGGVSQASLSLGTVTANTAFKIALAFAANDIAGCLNGGTVQTDTSATLPTVTTARIGMDTTGNQLDAPIASVISYASRQSNAQLQALTA